MGLGGSDTSALGHQRRDLHQAFKRGGYINDFAVRQQHFKDKVRLVMALETVRSDNAESRDFALLCKIFGPDDQEICTQRINLTGDKMNWEMDIDHPVCGIPTVIEMLKHSRCTGLNWNSSIKRRSMIKAL